MSRNTGTSTPEQPNTNRTSRGLLLVLAAIVAIAGGWATWTVNNAAHPIAAIILAIITALTVAKTISDLRQ